MSLTLVTEPTIEPLQLEDVEEHLRMSETSDGTEDALLTGFIGVARRYCEQYQNHAYIEQTWNLVLDAYPSEDYITIPLPPLMSVTHVKSYGTGGTATTMTAGNYYVDTDAKPGRLCLGYCESWPNVTLRPANGVEVQFVAGYGSARSSVPEEIRQAMHLIIGQMYEHRESSDVRQMSPAWIKNAFMGSYSILGLDRVWPI